jgi:hypothetical protein
MQGLLAVETTFCCDFFDTMHTCRMQKGNILHRIVIGVTIIALQQGLGLLDLSCISQLRG